MRRYRYADPPKAGGFVGRSFRMPRHPPEASRQRISRPLPTRARLWRPGVLAASLVVSFEVRSHANWIIRPFQRKSHSYQRVELAYWEVDGEAVVSKRASWNTWQRSIAEIEVACANECHTKVSVKKSQMKNRSSPLGSSRVERFCRVERAFTTITLLSLVGQNAFAAAPAPSGHQPNPLKAPLSFEQNEGQIDPAVKFLSRGDGYSLFLTPKEAVFRLKNNGNPSVVRMELLGASPSARVSGAEKLPGVANYHIGNDPTKWRTGISTYGKVRYQNIYPGVDAIFYGNQRQLEYDFVVAPGADPSRISLGLSGVRPTLDGDGNVVLKLADGNLVLKKPIVYQGTDGQKQVIAARYVITGNTVRFRLGKYDHGQTLVIDPVFDYLTYLGGTNYDASSAGTSLAPVTPQPQRLRWIHRGISSWWASQAQWISHRKTRSSPKMAPLPHRTKRLLLPSSIRLVPD